MIPATKKLICVFQRLSTLAVVSALWFGPLHAAAGELSEVPDGSKLQFSLPDIDGQQRSLDDFAGKVVLVNFWASWCRPCIVEMPSIQRLAEEMSDRPFAVIAINVGEAKRRVQTTVKRLDVDFPVLLDKDSAVFEDWGANVRPPPTCSTLAVGPATLGAAPWSGTVPTSSNMLERLAEQPPLGK